MYALYFILVVLICCVMMSKTVANEMKERVSLPLSSSSHFPRLMGRWCGKPSVKGMEPSCPGVVWGILVFSEPS